ncbi:MAG: glycerol-3-phosphate acyltransferase [Dehalococcoidia bacterium]|jgi:hypothetical protein|nr:glycerol-3-phosphate acyltransferase [Dehalococcoidia bacterium]
MAMGSIALVVGGYLLGALPFTVALAVASGLEPAEEPDLHIALWRRVGRLAATAATVVEIAKGAFPVLVGFGFSLPVGIVALSGAAAVAGQMWPPLRGHGEKGNTTGAGALITLLLLYRAYLPLVSLVFFAAGIALRYVTLVADRRAEGGSDHPLAYALPVGMLLGFGVAPLICRLTGEPQGLSGGLLLMFVLIVARRLTAGVLLDLAVGTKVAPMLLRRLLFDESLTGRG